MMLVRDLVDGSGWHVPGVADRLARHVPAPGDRRGDARVEAGADHSDPLDRLSGLAVDADAARYERIEGHQVVDDESHLLVSGLDVAELAGPGDGRTRTSDPEVRSVELERERYDVGLLVIAQRRNPSERL